MLMDSLRENADQFGIVLPLGGPIVECNDSSSEHKFPILTSQYQPPHVLSATIPPAAPTLVPNPVYAMPLNPDPPYAAPLFNALPGAAPTFGIANPNLFPDPMFIYQPTHQLRPLDDPMFNPFQHFNK